jgi:hypothetical protein
LPSGTHRLSTRANLPQSLGSHAVGSTVKEAMDSNTHIDMEEDFTEGAKKQWYCNFRFYSSQCVSNSLFRPPSLDSSDNLGSLRDTGDPCLSPGGKRKSLVKRRRGNKSAQAADTHIQVRELSFYFRLRESPPMKALRPVAHYSAYPTFIQE